MGPGLEATLDASEAPPLTAPQMYNTVLRPHTQPASPEYVVSTPHDKHPPYHTIHPVLAQSAFSAADVELHPAQPTTIARHRSASRSTADPQLLSLTPLTVCAPISVLAILQIWSSAIYVCSKKRKVQTAALRIPRHGDVTHT